MLWNAKGKGGSWNIIKNHTFISSLFQFANIRMSINLWMEFVKTSRLYLHYQSPRGRSIG
jgi:hypothetical protein